MIRVKICGINDEAAFDAAVATAADWIGFVFYPPSPRALSPARAATLSARYRDGPARVGLFVDPTDDEIAAALDALTLDALQLYAPPSRLAAIRARFGVPVWRALAVAGAEDLPKSAEGAEALVLDAAPPFASLPGGNAAAFDWSLLFGWTGPAPWLLAGGLTVANVAAAIRLSGARAVDVSSGVEVERGRKDPRLISAFIAAARG